MIKLIAVLGFAAFVFLMLRGLFQFLAWYYPDLDRANRDRVVKLFVELDDKSAFSIVQESLVHFVDGVDRLLSRRWFLAGFLAVALALNVTLPIVAVVEIVRSYSIAGDPWEILAERISAISPGVLVAACLLVAGLGCIFDLASLLVTRCLVRHAVSTWEVRSIALHILLDGLLTLVASAWALGTLAVLHAFFFDSLDVLLSDAFLDEKFFEWLRETPPLWGIVVGLGVAAALPMSFYVGVCATLLAVRYLPRGFQDALRDVTCNIAESKDSIFRQLGSFSSWAAGIATALIGVLRL